MVEGSLFAIIDLLLGAEVITLCGGLIFTKILNLKKIHFTSKNIKFFHVITAP